MKPDPDPAPAASGPVRAATFLSVALTGGIAWAMLTAGDASSAVIGVPTVLAAAGLAMAASTGGMAPRLAASAAFVPWFLLALMRSAWSLARRVLRPDPAFRPGVVQWRLRLSGDGARAAFMNAVSLTPGTLSAGLDGEVLTVHVLDTGEDPSADLDALERRIARLYGEALR